MRLRNLCLGALCLFLTQTVFCQGTAFTYQGRLNSNGGAASGTYDFLFALYNDSLTGSQVGATQTNSGVGVTNGLFLAPLDFGSTPWTGQRLWLQILVRTNGAVSFTPLSPRQEFGSTPYAVEALKSASAGAVAGSNIVGSISNSVLPVNPNFSGTMAGNGGGLTNLVATQLASGTVADARLSTNVALLSANQTFTGAKTFSNPFGAVSISGGPASTGLIVQGGLSGGFSGPVALIVNTNTGPVAGVALRVIGNGNSVDGAFSVSAQGTGLIAQFGNSNAFVSQLDTNGIWTATGFVGNGSGLTNISFGQLTGSLADGRLSANVALLNSNQTFTGPKTFANSVTFSPGSGTLSITNESGIVPGIVASGGVAPGHARFRNALEVFPDATGANGGYIDIRNNASNATISLTGSTGTVLATTVSASTVSATTVTGSSVNASSLGGNGGSIGVNTNVFLNSNPLFLRNDRNHGLGYNGFGITNFPNSLIQPDGPVLWGFSGGVLGVMNGGAQSALSWDNSGVTVANALNVGGNLSAANTPGVNWSQTYTSGAHIDVPSGFVTIDTCTNAKPAVGYFVVMGSAVITTAGHDASLTLHDNTTGTDVAWGFGSPTTGSQFTTLSFSYVQPITAAGGSEVFSTYVGVNSGGGGVTGHNLTVMYFPRRNN